MKKFLFFAFLYSFSLSSQNFRLATGDTFRISSLSLAEKYLGYDNTGYYYERWNAKGNVVYKVSGETGRIMYKLNTEPDAEKNKIWMFKKSFVQGTFIQRSKLLHFRTVVDKDIEKLILFEFDPLTGQPVKEPRTFLEVSCKGYDPLIGNAVTDFDIAYSADSSKMLLVSEKKKDKQEQDVTVWVYEAATSILLWQAKVPTVFRKSTISSRDYQVHDNGSVYFIFQYLRSESQTDVVEGIGMLDKGDKVAAYPLPETGKTLNKPVLELNENSLSCNANYLEGENKSYGSNVKKCGFVHIELTADLQPIQESFIEFSMDPSSLASYHFDRSYIIGNEKYVVWQFTTASHLGGWGGNIEVMKFDLKGNLLWKKTVPRRTFGPCAGIVFTGGKSLRIICYEHKKNQQLYPDLNKTDNKYEWAQKMKKAELISIEVDPAGNLKREVPKLAIKPFLPNHEHAFLNNPANRTALVKTSITKKSMSFGVLHLEN